MPKFLSNIDNASRVGITDTGNHFTSNNVEGALVELVGRTAPVTSVNTRTGAVVLTAADVGALSNTTNTWINDSQGNPRMQLGASTEASNQFIFRASNAAGTFQVRDSANTTRFAVNMANGEVTTGTVPWARLTSVPTTFTPAAHNQAWSTITTTPTTLSGYGITDAAPSSHVGATGTAHGVATASVNGFMSSTDKSKLDGIAAGAQVNDATNLGITAGTTAGPIVTSSTGTSATLPTASATASGVITTGAQTFAGDKTFSSQIISNVATGTPPFAVSSTTRVSNLNAATSGSAETLTTARTIELGTAVTSTATSFNGSSNITIPVNSVSESFLIWGGRSLAGQVSPIGMSLSDEHGANRLAFINGNALDFEYSSDAGSTWTNYDYSAIQKSQFCTTSLSVPIGRISGEYTTSSRTRVTLTAQNGSIGYVYTNPRKMLINISSSGGMQVLVETRTGANYQISGAWSTFGTYTLSGWSGWNDIPLVLGTLGGGTTQTNNNWQLRLTFIMTSKNNEHPTTASVNNIRIFGENAWQTPSTLAATNNLYSFDMSQNVTFPANLNTNGTLSLRASGSGSAATQIPVFTSNPSSSTTTLVTRTPAELRADIGAYAASNPSGYTSNTGTVTSISGTGSVSGITLSGTVTSTGNLTLGGTLAVTPSNFAQQNEKTFLAAPNSGNGTPSFRLIQASDVPILNQNTTGTASNVTGTVAIANGGTGATTAAAALTNLGLTATAAEINILDGLTATTAELNHVDGVTSNIQTQLNARAASSHTHGNITNAGAIGTTAGLMVITTTSGVLTTLAAGTTSQFLRGDGTWVTPPDTNTTYTAGSGIGLSGTTFSVAGGNGLVQETTGLSLGTPDTLTATSTNALTTTSHTHAITTTEVGAASTIVRTNSSGILAGRTGTGTIGVNTQGTPSFEAVGDATNAAYMTFHRSGVYAVRFGLDTDNQLKVGGWSMGNVSHVVLHSGNYESYTPKVVISATTPSGTFKNGDIWFKT